MTERSKNYKSMLKDHKKNILMKASSASVTPFDGMAGIEVLVAHLRFMHDYYALGENVYSQEPTELNGQTRYEILDSLLELYDVWQTKDIAYNANMSAANLADEIAKLDRESMEAKNKFFELLSASIEYLYD